MIFFSFSGFESDFSHYGDILKIYLHLLYANHLQIKLHEQQTNKKLSPWNAALSSALDKLQELDKCSIFARPVPVEQVVGGLFGWFKVFFGGFFWVVFRVVLTHCGGIVS